MTSANGGNYAGQYPCDGWVDNLEPTPSIGRIPKLVPSSIDSKQVESVNAEQCAYRKISTRSSDATTLVACAPPLWVRTKASENLASL